MVQTRSQTKKQPRNQRMPPPNIVVKAPASKPIKKEVKPIKAVK
jgi:hypothetical protein